MSKIYFLNMGGIRWPLIWYVHHNIHCLIYHICTLGTTIKIEHLCPALIIGYKLAASSSAIFIPKKLRSVATNIHKQYVVYLESQSSHIISVPLSFLSISNICKIFVLHSSLSDVAVSSSSDVKLIVLNGGR